MCVRAYSAAFRLVIVLAMLMGFLLPPAGISPSHDPAALAAAQAQRHAELQAEFAGHGHVHDDGFSDEQDSGHAHGHNPADHSHETPSLFADLTSAAPPVGRGWNLMPPAFAYTETSFRLDRPPRPIAVA